MPTSSNVWAITAYFNPERYQRRYLNYQQFRKALNVPLVTVELSLGDGFELEPKDADILVQVNGRSVLWHKESLLNIALRSVPREVPYVAWIDCDVIFARSDWAQELARQLATFRLVQLFATLHDLSAEQSLAPTVLEGVRVTGRAVASLIDAGQVPATAFAPQRGADMRSTSFGIAWGARADLMREQGIYDAMIAGSGDRALLCAAVGNFDAAISALELSPVRAAHYLNWARPFHRAVSGNVGYVRGSIFHLWHGSIERRSYKRRHEQLASLEFDPETDCEFRPIVTTRFAGW